MYKNKITKKKNNGTKICQINVKTHPVTQIKNTIWV
jgi:hypothetical protein